VSFTRLPTTRSKTAAAGVTCTITGSDAYTFLEKLINVILPNQVRNRIRRVTSLSVPSLVFVVVESSSWRMCPNPHPPCHYESGRVELLLQSCPPAVLWNSPRMTWTHALPC
jgi:hypothetical protein